MDSNNEQKIANEENFASKEIIEIKNENVELVKELLEKMSSASMKKGSVDIDAENPEEKDKKSLKFGGWLPDVLDWIKRTELAQSSLSISSLTLNRYCWPHLHGRKMKPHIVKKLTFLRGWDNEGNWYKILEKDDKIMIPIANINPPDYIIGFENIFFWFVDNRVLQFVQAILPMFKEKVEIKFRKFENNSQIGQIENLLAMLASKTGKLEISENAFNDLNKSIQQFPNYITGFQSICLITCNSGSEMDSIMKWLSEPREDDKPKMLETEFRFEAYANRLIDRIREDFLQSIKPVNFIIWMPSRSRPLYFERE